MEFSKWNRPFKRKKIQRKHTLECSSYSSNSVCPGDRAGRARQSMTPWAVTTRGIMFGLQSKWRISPQRVRAGMGMSKIIHWVRWKPEEHAWQKAWHTLCWHCNIHGCTSTTTFTYQRQWEISFDPHSVQLSNIPRYEPILLAVINLQAYNILLHREFILVLTCTI